MIARSFYVQSVYHYLSLGPSGARYFRSLRSAMKCARKMSTRLIRRNEISEGEVAVYKRIPLVGDRCYAFRYELHRLVSK